MHRLLTRTAILLIAACAFGQSSWTPDQSVAGAGKVFADLRAEWASNLRDKNVDACVAEFAPDAEFFQPDGSAFAVLRQLESFTSPSPRPLIAILSSTQN